MEVTPEERTCPHCGKGILVSFDVKTKSRRFLFLTKRTKVVAETVLSKLPASGDVE